RPAPPPACSPPTPGSIAPAPRRPDSPSAAASPPRRLPRAARPVPALQDLVLRPQLPHVLQPPSSRLQHPDQRLYVGTGPIPSPAPRLWETTPPPAAIVLSPAPTPPPQSAPPGWSAAPRSFPA